MQHPLVRLASASLLVACLTFGAGVRADDTAAEPEPYRALLKDALTEYEAGRYEEARALFRQAHTAFPNARTLRGIGMASFELRDYVAALDALEAALVDRRRPLTEDQRRQVTTLADRTRAFVGRYRVQLDPPHARLTVDGRPAPLRDSELRLAFGPHLLEATCEGCEPERRELRVAGGEVQDLRFSLRARPSTAAPVGIAERSTPVASSDRTARWITAGDLGAAAGGAAAWWWHQRGEVDRCREAGPDCQNGGALQTRRNLALGTSLGMALLGGAAAVWAAWPEENSALARLSTCVPIGNGITCRMRF